MPRLTAFDQLVHRPQIEQLDYHPRALLIRIGVEQRCGPTREHPAQDANREGLDCRPRLLGRPSLAGYRPGNLVPVNVFQLPPEQVKNGCPFRFFLASVIGLGQGLIIKAPGRASAQGPPVGACWTHPSDGLVALMTSDDP
jgi:hypothetical protein